MPTIGTSTGSSTPSEPAGIGPSTRTARTPAAASSRTTSGVVGPVGSSAARSGDAAVPRVVEQRVERVPLGDRDDLPARKRRDGSRDDSGRRDGAAERRLTGREDAQARAQEDVHRRASTARVGRRDAERPGRAAGSGDAPEPGPAAPSFPAGATTSVSSASAPSDAVCSGASGKEANGSTTPTSAIRTASWASPSPFGSTAASRPASTWSVRPYTDTPPSESGCQPATRIGRIDAPGATPWIPAGPRTPTTRPASSVPWRSGRPGWVGFCSADASLPGSTMSSPGSSLPCRNGCRVSTPVSSSATVMPEPLNPGSSISGRRPLPVANTSVSRIEPFAGTAAG